MEDFRPVILYVFFIVSCVNSQIINSGVSCDDVQTIVDEHNKYRLQVANSLLEGQPPAIDMQTLVWDDSLQRLAQDWANNMQFQHNAARNSNASETYIGENIYQSWTSYDEPGFSWVNAIKAWFDEHSLYTYQPVSSSNFSATGHYTQLVWAATKYVGCGATHYRSNNGNTKLYVCNYRIGGNMQTEYPYETGSSGQNELLCEEQCSQLYGSSCSKK